MSSMPDYLIIETASRRCSGIIVAPLTGFVLDKLAPAALKGGEAAL